MRLPGSFAGQAQRPKLFRQKAILWSTPCWSRVRGTPRLRSTTTSMSSPLIRAEWSSDPFTLTVTRGRYTGRGATDDKGPALAAMTAAVLARDAGIPLNFQFLWELEEEIGSPHFASFLRERKRQITADSVLVSDTIWVARGTPSIPYGLRGLLPASLSLKTARADVHSGCSGRGRPEPLLEIIRTPRRMLRCGDREGEDTGILRRGEETPEG